MSRGSLGADPRHVCAGGHNLGKNIGGRQPSRTSTGNPPQRTWAGGTSHSSAHLCEQARSPPSPETWGSQTGTLVENFVDSNAKLAFGTAMPWRHGPPSKMSLTTPM